MADGRDFRVRWGLRFSNVGIANALTNHANGLMDKTIPINPGRPNEELPFVREADHWDSLGDMNFDNQGMARGLLNHIRALLPQATSPDDMVGFVELEWCGHRLGTSCNAIERYVVGV